MPGDVYDIVRGLDLFCFEKLGRGRPMAVMQYPSYYKVPTMALQFELRALQRHPYHSSWPANCYTFV